MSNTMRWIIAILLSLTGIAAAIFSIFGGAFTTIGCLETPPDWVYYFLFVVAAFNLAGTIGPAIMLVRKAAGRSIALVFVLGMVFSCVAFSMYYYFLGGYC